MEQFEDPREIKVGVGKSFLSVENRIYFGTGFFFPPGTSKVEATKEKIFQIEFRRKVERKERRQQGNDLC